MRQLLAILGGVMLTGCAVLDETTYSYRPDSICIERNSAVAQEGFVQGLQQEFGRHGISAKSYRNLPQYCSYVLSYHPARGRGLPRSENHIDLVIRDEQGQVWASTRYQGAGQGGIAQAMGNSTAGSPSLEPVVNELVAQAGWALYEPEANSGYRERQLRDL